MTEKEGDPIDPVVKIAPRREQCTQIFRECKREELRIAWTEVKKEREKRMERDKRRMIFLGLCAAGKRHRGERQRL